YVAYLSGLPDQLFVWDSRTQANIYSRPSTDLGFSFVLSPDGRTLVFQSASNLDRAVVARDLVAGTDRVIGYSAISGGPEAQISANGRFVTFISAADAPNTSNGSTNVFLSD